MFSRVEFWLESKTTVWNLKNICLILKPVPGIQIGGSVKIKIAVAEYFPLQFQF